jgi:hypothetical protein
VDDRLGVHDDRDPVEVHPEELVRLDHLEALVHERRRVDGDLGAHVPGGVLERLGDRDPLELGAGLPPEGPTARGEDDPLDLVGGAAAQRLVDGGVLGVDGDDLATAAGPGAGDDGPAGDEALLVGQREPLAVRERGQGGRQAGEPDDGVQHDVGLGQRRELGQRVGIVDAAPGAVGGEPERGALLLEQVGVAPRRQGHDLVAAAGRRDDVERLCADRSGRTEQHDPDGLARCGPGYPARGRSLPVDRWRQPIPSWMAR